MQVTCDSIFTPERLAVAANNLLNDVPEIKREGDVIAQCGLREKLYASSGSNHRACNLLRQQRFLTNIVARLQSSPSEVVSEIQAMRAVLTREGGMMIQVVGNIVRLALQGLHPLIPLIDAFPPAVDRGDKQVRVRQPGQVRLAQQLHSTAVASPPGVASVVAMGALESCFLYAAARGLPSFQHEHTAPMLVATELLTCIEGPMWNVIRGAGLAYSFTMYGDADEGLCYFSLSRSPAVGRAYVEAGSLIASFASGETPITAMALENSKASVMSSIVSRESTVGQCGMQSLMNALRRSGPAHNARLLSSVASVSQEQVMYVIQKYLLALFSPQSANVFITTSPAKFDEVVRTPTSLPLTLLLPLLLRANVFIITTSPAKFDEVVFTLHLFSYSIISIISII